MSLIVHLPGQIRLATNPFLISARVNYWQRLGNLSGLLLGGYMAQEFSKKFYSSKQWQDCRNGYGSMRGWLCEDCLKRGLYRPGIEVHHIEELTPMNIHRPEITLSYDNLVLLCRECHKARHDRREKDKRYVIESDGKIFLK